VLPADLITHDVRSQGRKAGGDVSSWPASTVRGSAAIRPESEHKPTWRCHLGLVEIDPYATSARCSPIGRYGISSKKRA